MLYFPEVHRFVFIGLIHHIHLSDFHSTAQKFERASQSSAPQVFCKMGESNLHQSKNPEEGSDKSVLLAAKRIFMQFQNQSILNVNMFLLGQKEQKLSQHSHLPGKTQSDNLGSYFCAFSQNFSFKPEAVSQKPEIKVNK